MDRGPGELQPIGSQRVSHHWSDLASMHIWLWGIPGGASGIKESFASAGDILQEDSFPTEPLGMLVKSMYVFL